MGRAYERLLVNDTSTPQTRWMARKGSDDDYILEVDFSNDNENSGYFPGVAYLAGRLFNLVQQGITFRNCVFTTHGAGGAIKFGTDELTSYGWYSGFYNRGFHRLFPKPDATVYFAGCEVALGKSGWQFLEAAARCLLQGAGGWAVGWTSNGYKIPFINAPQHFSGEVRRVYVSAGQDYLRFYEGATLIADDQGFPIRP